jgi:DNA-binding XRE family transcriptional regulator
VNYLKFWRCQMSLTQEEAAEEIGIGLSAYTLIEAGRLQPSERQQAQLSRRFGRQLAHRLLRKMPIPRAILAEKTGN